MHLPRTLLLAALTLPCLAATPSTLPSTLPIDPELQRLIATLGDTDFKTREEASKKILARGKAAIPALQQAAKLNDPEIQLRAELLIKRLSVRELPGGPFPRYKNGRPTAHSLRVAPDDKGTGTLIELTDEGRQIRILKTPGDIQLTVSVLQNGNRVSETYKARDAEQLREISPDAYAVFDRWGGGPGPGWVVRGGDDGPLRTAPDPVEAMSNLIHNAMDEAGTPEHQQQQVRTLLAEFRAASTRLPIDDGAQQDRRLQLLFALSDRLRSKLDELNLPDPGEALPPPQSGRLGIELAGGDTLIVNRVVSDSRADLIGLKPGDIIVKVNNRDVRSLPQLRQALLDFRPPITLETLRADKTLQLKEPAPAAK